MQKYNVRSGTVEISVIAASAGKAAVWAVHRVMQQIVPMGEDRDTSGARDHRRGDNDENVWLQKTDRLGSEVHVWQCRNASVGEASGGDALGISEATTRREIAGKPRNLDRSNKPGDLTNANQTNELNEASEADVTTLATIEVIGAWNQMVCTLDRLDRILQHAV